jgi:hypothetical protein
MSSAKTPPIFLIASGIVMVYALATSKKAKNVIKTSVDLARQEEGDEMFGSSALARITAHHAFKHIILAFNLFLLAIFNVTTNKKYHSYYDKYKHTEEAGVEHDESYQGTDGESHKCGNKPTTNH